MTKLVSKTIESTNPTQLDGAKDKATKKSKSTKRVDQPKSANSANTSDSLNSENPLKIVKSRSVAIDPNLFADELVPSVKSEDTSEMDSGSSTDSKSESVDLNPTNSPDEKKSSDGYVALDFAPPVQSEESDSTPDISSLSESSSLDETASQSETNPLKESDELNELDKSEESNSDIALNSPNELNPASEPKPTRISAKMRRQELDDYVERFLQPGQIAKRHTVVIEEDTWKRISYNVRKIGLEDSTGSAYVEAILRDHLNRYEDKVEEWRKL